MQLRQFYSYWPFSVLPWLLDGVLTPCISGHSPPPPNLISKISTIPVKYLQYRLSYTYWFWILMILMANLILYLHRTVISAVQGIKIVDKSLSQGKYSSCSWICDCVQNCNGNSGVQFKFGVAKVVAMIPMAILVILFSV